MPRPKRITTGGFIYHAMGRAIPGFDLFRNPADYRAFENLLKRALQRIDVRLLC